MNYIGIDLAVGRDVSTTMFAGVRVIEDHNALKMTRVKKRYPRNRKRRMRRDWSKPQFWTYKYEPAAYIVYDVVVAHPVLYGEIARQFSRDRLLGAS